LAQAGVPLTGGFVAKLSVFSAAVDQRQYALALIGMLAAAVAAFVYLRIILAMYAPADDEEQPTFHARVDYGTGLAITIAAAAVLDRDGRVRDVVEGFVGQLVRGVDQLAGAREVEEVARVGRTRQHDHLDRGRDVLQLELEPLAARVGEARHHDVERGALDAL